MKTQLFQKNCYEAELFGCAHSNSNLSNIRYSNLAYPGKALPINRYALSYTQLKALHINNSVSFCPIGISDFHMSSEYK